MSKNEILLGDNPFFGIDHLSQERARARLKVLTNFEKITEIIEHVTKLGVKGFVVSTHPNLQLLISYMEKNTDLLNKLEFYPIFPYAQGYVSKVTEKGTIGAINYVLTRISAKNKIKVLIKGSVSYLTRDINKVIQVFTDLELDSVKDVQINTVFLHDVITDPDNRLRLERGARNIRHIYYRTLSRKDWSCNEKLSTFSKKIE